MNTPTKPCARPSDPTAVLITQTEADCTALLRRLQDRLDAISDTVVTGAGVSLSSDGPGLRLVVCERAGYDDERSGCAGAVCGDG